MDEPDAITRTLAACAAGDPSAWDRLAPFVYAELRRLAESYMGREREGHTLQPTALVHESYLRLVSQRLPKFESRSHFYGLAAQIMRQVLVDSARAYRSQKRGGGAEGRLPLDGNEPAIEGQNWGILDLHEALTKLAHDSAVQAQAIELHYFGGLAVAEIARVTGRSERTLARELRAGRLSLGRLLGART